METFAPCLGVNNSCFIAISTALDDDNYLSKIFTSTDEATKRLFSTLHIETWCAACKKAGISAYHCMKLKHEDDKLPSWKNSRNNEQVSQLLTQDDLFASEQAGTIRARKCVFEAEWIKRLMNAPRTRLTRQDVAVVYTWIDPSGGGMQSDLGILSLAVLQSRKIVVVGVSRGRNRNHREESETVRGHFHALTTMEATREALQIPIVERNYGGMPTVTRIQDTAKEFGNTIPYDEALNCPGVWTTDISKEQAMQIASNELQKGTVSIAEELATSSIIGLPETLGEFFAQLQRIQKRIKPSRNNINRYEYSGKGHNKGDDLGIGFPLLLHRIVEYQRLEHYKRVAAALNQSGTLFD